MTTLSRVGGAILIFCFWRASPAWAQSGESGEAGAAPRDLTSLSIEELMEIEVTSVSRKEQKLSDAAAAIYVINQEDIRRSGLKSIPELLRMVPGLQVARIDASKWAISSRGFNSRFANKLLVLIDGRSVYTPLFSGVYWEVQDTLLEDVERIEVIRGPGASVWGANAVNGVINIITKKAKDTQGGLVIGGTGSEELALGGIRYGGKLGPQAHWRAYLKYLNHDDFVDAGGRDTADEWDMLRGGFRMDWDLTRADLVTVQGDLYYGEVGSRSTAILATPPFSSTFNDRFNVFGGNILGRWTRVFSETSEMALQSYYDGNDRDDTLLKQSHHTFDLDFQHRFSPLSRHEVLWGLGYRLRVDSLEDGPSLSVNGHHRLDNVLSAFLQDEVTLIEDRLRLTLGSKFEHNDYTGFEIQPNGRLHFTPHPRHAVWGAVSRAVRTPSRVEHDSRINTVSGPGLLAQALGDRDFESEDLLAFELGYRVRPVDRLSLDLAAFYNLYRDLRTVEVDVPAPPLFPLHFDNKMDGETYGAELAANLKVTDRWRLSGGVTFLRMQLHADSSSTDSIAEDPEGQSPRHQAHLRSYLSLPFDLELDLFLYYVDRLPAFDIPAYFRLDARLGWRPRKDLELSVGVQNAFDDRHPEFGTEIFTNPTEVEHAVYGMLRWKF